jgi:hypothetical protein
MFFGGIKKFKNSNNYFRVPKFVMGLPFFKRWKIATNYIYVSTLPHSTLIDCGP